MADRMKKIILFLDFLLGKSKSLRKLNLKMELSMIKNVKARHNVK